MKDVIHIRTRVLGILAARLFVNLAAAPVFEICKSEHSCQSPAQAGFQSKLQEHGEHERPTLD